MIKGKIISTTCQYSRQCQSIVQCFSKVAKHCAVNILLPLLETPSLLFCLLTLTHLWGPSSNIMPSVTTSAPQAVSHLPLQKHFVHISATALVPFFILLYLSAPQQIWELLKDRSGMLFNPSPSTPYHTGGLADCKCTLKNLTKSNQLSFTLLWLWVFYIIWETNT